MADDPVSVARKCFQAYADKDREAVERLIAADLRFTSPLDNGIDRKTYFERCWPNSKTISGFHFVNLVSDGDRAIVTYEGRTEAGKRFRNTEVLTVREGKIVEVEVYFGWSIPHEAKPGGFVDKSSA